MCSFYSLSLCSSPSLFFHCPCLSATCPAEREIKTSRAPSSLSPQHRSRRHAAQLQYKTQEQLACGLKCKHPLFNVVVVPRFLFSTWSCRLLHRMLWLGRFDSLVNATIFSGSEPDLLHLAKNVNLTKTSIFFVKSQGKVLLLLLFHAPLHSRRHIAAANPILR